jgi:peptidyl-prolyl cis-trans isomerase C
MKRCILVLLALSGSALWPQTSASGNLARLTSQSSSGLQAAEKIAQQDPKRVVATIDGTPVTAEQALTLLKEIPDNQRPSGNLESVLERMYLISQLSNQALQQNLQNQSPWKQDLQFTRDQILAQAYLQHLNTPGSAAAQSAKQYYDSHPEEFEQTRLSGIFVAFAAPGTPNAAGKIVRTEEEARAKADDLEKKLKAGSDFATLARTESDNQASAANGGDLGVVNSNDPRLPASIKTALANLQPGQISEPVRIPNGFYIFKVVSRTKMPFDDQLRSQIITKQIFDQYKIQVKDPAFFATNATNTPSLANPSPNKPPTASVPSQTPATPAKPASAHP